MNEQDKPTIKKRGRKKLGEGLVEKRLILESDDVQRLNILTAILYESSEEYQNANENQKTSMLVSDMIRERFNTYSEDGTLMKHLTSLAE